MLSFNDKDCDQVRELRKEMKRCKKAKRPFVIMRKLHSKESAPYRFLEGREVTLVKELKKDNHALIITTE